VTASIGEFHLDDRFIDAVLGTHDLHKKVMNFSMSIDFSQE
jgi:hypothetical protein